MDFYAAEMDPPGHLLTELCDERANTSTRHTVIPFPNFRGAGKRPVFTPAHHVDFDTGIGPSGPRIEEILTKPSSGRARGVPTAGRITESMRI